LKKKKAVKRGKVTLQELFEANDRVMRLRNGNSQQAPVEKVNLKEMKKHLLLERAA
jgi:hypothetical protein